MIRTNGAATANLLSRLALEPLFSGRTAGLSGNSSASGNPEALPCRDEKPVPVRFGAVAVAVAAAVGLQGAASGGFGRLRAASGGFGRLRASSGGFGRLRVASGGSGWLRASLGGALTVHGRCADAGALRRGGESLREGSGACRCRLSAQVVGCGDRPAIGARSGLRSRRCLLSRGCLLAISHIRRWPWLRCVPRPWPG